MASESKYRYQATIEFGADEPLEGNLLECVSAGLWVAIDDPSNDDGEGLSWSGSPTNITISPASTLSDEIAGAIRKRLAAGMSPYEIPSGAVELATADILDAVARYEAARA